MLKKRFESMLDIVKNCLRYLEVICSLNCVSKVNLDAACVESTVWDVQKYWYYISITKNITEGNNLLIGKIVTLYGHVDLDLDESASIFIDGKVVNIGDLISGNLYSWTAGGSHLHFEIRYYRATNVDNETFYGFSNSPNPELTEPSAGQRLYSFWNPNVGYGFGNPITQELNFWNMF